MSTRHVSLYVAGKPVIQCGGYDKSSLKDIFTHYVLGPWHSEQCNIWMRNYGTEEPVWHSPSGEYLRERRLYVRIVYCVKHRKSRRCVYINGYVLDKDRKLSITSVDTTKENRLFYNNCIDALPDINKVLSGLDGE